MYRHFQSIAVPKTSDCENLVDSCRFYPDADTWQSIHDELPGLLTVCMNAISKLAGATADDAAKK